MGTGAWVVGARVLATCTCATVLICCGASVSKWRLQRPPRPLSLLLEHGLSGVPPHTTPPPTHRYSFNYMNAHFIMMDTETDIGPKSPEGPGTLWNAGGGRLMCSCHLLHEHMAASRLCNAPMPPRLLWCWLVCVYR